RTFPRRSGVGGGLVATPPPPVAGPDGLAGSRASRFVSTAPSCVRCPTSTPLSTTGSPDPRSDRLLLLRAVGLRRRPLELLRDAVHVARVGDEALEQLPFTLPGGRSEGGRLLVRHVETDGR